MFFEKKNGKCEIIGQSKFIFFTLIMMTITNTTENLYFCRTIGRSDIKKKKKNNNNNSKKKTKLILKLINRN